MLYQQLLAVTEQVVGDADFGDVIHTGSVTQLFNVTNSGGISATLVAEGGLAPPYSFAGGYPGGVGGSFCPAVTVPVGTCEIEVTFSPSSNRLWSNYICRYNFYYI